MGIIHSINTRDLQVQEASHRIDGSFAASLIGDLAATQAKRLDLIVLNNAPVLAVEMQVRNAQFTSNGTFGINGAVSVTRPLTASPIREAFTRRFIYTGTQAALGTGVDVRLTPSQLDHLVTGTVIPRAGEGIGGITNINPIINGTATATQLAAAAGIPVLNAPFTRSYPQITFGLELYGTALTGNITLDVALRVWYLAPKESDRPVHELKGYGNVVAYGQDIIASPSTGDFDIATSLTTIAASVTAAS